MFSGSSKSGSLLACLSWSYHLYGHVSACVPQPPLLRCSHIVPETWNPPTSSANPAGGDCRRWESCHSVAIRGYLFRGTSPRMSIHVYLCVCVCVYVSMYACMHVGMYVRMFIHMLCFSICTLVACACIVLLAYTGIRWYFLGRRSQPRWRAASRWCLAFVSGASGKGPRRQRRRLDWKGFCR